MNLGSLVREAAARQPGSCAVRGPDRVVSYQELDEEANRVAAALRELGVRAGDRVALWMEKSVSAVAAMQAVLRLGAAYVPIDPLGPPARARKILESCAASCLVTSGVRARSVLGATARPTLLATNQRASVLAGWMDGPRAPWLAWDDVERLSPSPHPTPAGGEALAYILYTSGSTGVPKGVCISHRNALSFVDAMVAALGVAPSDRLSNHAPFHFDLSVFDLYAAFRSGASVSLVPETMAYAPRELVGFLHREAVTIWYSVPSALTLMMNHTGILDSSPPPNLRAVLFAGEVFPVQQLARLRRAWPNVRFLNLYGPTETNVCTLYEVRKLEEGTAAVPIGHACCGDRVWARADDGTEVVDDQIGELMVEGPTVMLGYWGEPPQGKVYATGDLVRRRSDGEYVFVGRRDHMVKVRGFRVELAEIEAALASHPSVTEVAVVAEGPGEDLRLVAYVVSRDAPPTLVSLKRHCVDHLPRYMAVHDVRYVRSLPRTSTGKVDRKALRPDSGGTRDG
jgi:amino acid adenylation domain-containing protein